MDKLKCMTYNAKGLKDSAKRDGVFYWLKKKKMDVICIQEAHCEKETLKKWEEEWGNKIYASHGTGNSRGVCIMIGSNKDINTELVKADEDGRYIIIKASIGENRLKIAGYYGPNKDDPTTMDNMLTEIDNTEAEHIILMGDFNFTMDPKIDKKGGTENNNTKCRDVLVNWMEDHSMCEIWRTRNPDERQFTWRSNNKPPIFCRLDFFVVSPSITNNCQKCTIGPGVRSDHSYVRLETEFPSPPRGRGFWKLDISLLEDTGFKEELAKAIKQTEEDNSGTEPTLMWETIKSTVRGECISYNNKRKRKMNNTIRKLEMEIKELESKEWKDDNKEEKETHNLKDLKNQLEQHIEEKGRREACKNRNLLYELGEKPNKYFLNKGRERSANNVIRRLVREDGQEITEPKEIINEEIRFYKKLYTSQLQTSDSRQDDLEQITKDIEQLDTPSIDNNKWEELTKPITEEELWKVIQSCADNKSPGTDGLNNNFYKAMWPHIKKYLINSIQTTLERGDLSISQKQGIVSLIPKPNKDTRKLKNWRPITLLNQDYKYLAKCLANRCKGILPDIINPDQTGFVPGRLIGTNIIKAQNILNHMKEEQKDGIMMCVDFEKAFDTIEWSYITTSLKKFNFPPILIEWIKTLYNNISTCIINNGHASTFFNPTRGVRQGCPLSPVLFVIAVELMATTIRENKEIQGIQIGNKEIKLSQFADDTTLYLKPTQKCITEAFHTIDSFSKVTGLRTNKEKTEILLMGTCDGFILNKDIQKYVKKEVKILGVHICNERKRLIEINFEPIKDKIKNTINFWNKMNLSIQGKITIIKTLIVSKLVYVLNVLPSPTDTQLKELQDMLYKFLWDNKPDKIKREIIISGYEDGGLKMPDLKNQNIGLKTAWIKKLSEKDGNWKESILGRLPLNDPQYFMECSIKFSDIPNKPPKDDFWFEALIHWCILNKSHTDKTEWMLEDIYQENLWWNSKIKINKKVLEYKKWGKKGVKKIHHLLTDEGEWLSHSEFENKYNIRTPFTLLTGLQRAIKESWGEITKMDISDIEETKDRLVDKLEKKRKDSQVIYWMLVDQKKIFPTTRRHKWEKDLGKEITVQEWKNHLVKSRKLNESSKMQSWSYKFIMRLVPYNTKLQEMGLAPSPLCTFCKEEPETLKHLYWTCNKIQPIKNHLEEEFKIDIGIGLGLLGLNSKRYKYKEGIYMKLHIMRYHIHLCKCNGVNPSVRGLKNLTKQMMMKDWEVATRNNQHKRFNERWGNSAKLLHN
jgi:exonuclease III